MAQAFTRGFSCIAASGLAMPAGSDGWVVDFTTCVGGVSDRSLDTAAHSKMTAEPTMAHEAETFETWVVDIESRVEGAEHTLEEVAWSKPSIYHVPEFIRKHKQEAFTPLVVSIGPFHHGEPQLQPLEDPKRRALAHFLRRASKPLNVFVDAIRNVMPQLQDSYSGLDEKWKADADAFVMLMVTNGCFMLEVLKRDFLVLENQLPLLALKTLLKAEKGGPVVT